MKNHDSLKPALIGLAKLQIHLEMKGGPSEDGQLYEQTLLLQDGILQSFGLPSTPKNIALLWFTQLPSDSEIDERVKHLHEYATIYLLSNAKPELQILREAQEQNLDPFEVLPELDIVTHSYTIYIYSNVLLKRKDSIENVLHQLKFVNNSRLLNLIGNLEQDNVENPTEAIKYLKQNGVKYLVEFLSASTNKNEMNQSNQLIKFLNDINGKSSFNSNEEWFASMANGAMNHLCLSVGKNAYRITECEIYYMDIEHQDPYVHCGEEQMTAGKLYLNKAGGLDITFGNADIPAWGGILIRGIRNLKTNEYTNQITKIVEEVFKSLGNIITGENGIYLRELMPDQIEIQKPIQSTRVGLVKKEQDSDNYFDKPYRYIVELNPAHKFKEKENVVKQLLSENNISNEKVKTILGYNLK